MIMYTVELTLMVMQFVKRTCVTLHSTSRQLQSSLFRAILKALPSTYLFFFQQIPWQGSTAFYSTQKERVAVSSPNMYSSILCQGGILLKCANLVIIQLPILRKAKKGEITILHRWSESDKVALTLFTRNRSLIILIFQVKCDVLSILCIEEGCSVQEREKIREGRRHSRCALTLSR